MEYGWIWVAVIILAVVVEAFTDQLISIWFVPAAIVAVILDFCNVDIILQVIVFLAIALAGIFGLRKFLNSFKVNHSTKTNIDAIVGERCIVTEKIDNFAGCGQAKVKGQVWSARGVGENDVFEVGETLTVVAIEGVKLICKK